MGPPWPPWPPWLIDLVNGDAGENAPRYLATAEL